MTTLQTQLTTPIRVGPASFTNTYQWSNAGRRPTASQHRSATRSSPASQSTHTHSA